LFIKAINRAKSDSVKPQDDTIRLKWLLILGIFLLPISLPVGAFDVSSNYSYAILLVYLLPVTQWPTFTKWLILYCAICYVCFQLFFELPGQNNGYIRQVLSMAIYIIPILITAIRLPFRLKELELVLIMVATLYALWGIGTILYLSPHIDNITVVKYVLASYLPDWPQRYPLLVTFAFFVTLRWCRSHPSLVIGAILQAILIFYTAVISLHLVFLFGVASLALWYCKQKNGRAIANLIGVLVSAVLMLYLLPNSTDPSISFTKTRIDRAYNVIVTLFDANPESADFHSEFTTTEKTDVSFSTAELKEMNIDRSTVQRLLMWKQTLRTIIDHDLWLGSGFAGIYLFNNAIGSTHNQYLDVLFRTGVIGLLLYLLFWKQLFQFMLKYSPELTIALFTWFVFGLYHETTKYPYVSFIFFCYYNFLSRLHVPSNGKN